jgi:hypothetical protein
VILSDRHQRENFERRDLLIGLDRYGIKTHWHKRVIRSGPNALSSFTKNPPDRIIQQDDILFIDLGPVFEAWEADFGRTFVLGNDPIKKKPYVGRRAV